MFITYSVSNGYLILSYTKYYTLVYCKSIIADQEKQIL